LVDNSVVVAENIYRLHRGGAERRHACIHGAGEVALAITMSTLTTIVVFLPVSLVEGPGQFFLTRLAIPVCVSLAASLVVALVFIPLCVYLTLPNRNATDEPGGFKRFHDRGVGVFGLENAVLPVGDAFLELVAPVKPDTAAGRWIDRRGGDAGYMTIFQTADLADARAHVERLGVRVVWEASLDHAATFHLHPRDLGGAIVSLDWMDPPESWEWAGPGWQERVRDEVATGLAGAVLEAADPEKLAARWGEVLGVAPVAADAGGFGLPLAQGTRLRFVGRADAEPALAGVEVAVRDRDHFAREAERAGVAQTDGSALIAGTRIVPV
ncbi:MAG: efflux RND transporter permease subunit, partial [Myxococcota bacterium]